MASTVASPLDVNFTLKKTTFCASSQWLKPLPPHFVGVNLDTSSPFFQHLDTPSPYLMTSPKSIQIGQSQGTYSNCIFKFPVFPVFSLSNCKFETITYTKPTWQTYATAKKNLELCTANIAIFFTFSMREFTT